MGHGTKKFFAALSVFLLVWICLKFLLPLFSPFLVGLALALAAEPLVSRLHRQLRVPRSISSGIGVTMAFFLLAMVLLLLCAFLIRELKLLSGALPDLEQTARSGITMLQNWLLSLTDRTPRSLRPLLQENISTLFSDGASLLDRAMGYLLSLAGNLLSHIPDSALGLGTSIISGYMLSAKLPKIRRWVRRRIPRDKLKALLAVGKRVKTILGCWLLAQFKLMGVTFFLLLLGLTMLRIPYAPLWALGVTLVDAFPVLGTGTVLLPWALISFLQNNTPQAIGLAGLYATISLVRSILEPKFLGSHLGLDPLVTLMALYVGFQLWGIGGMILAPVLTVTALQLVPDRKREL